MKVARFSQEVRLAAKLLESGAYSPPLCIDSDVAGALGIDKATCQRIRSAEVDEQVKILRPFLVHHRDTERAAKVDAASKIAAKHVALLNRGLRVDGDDLELPAPPLIDIVMLSAFKVLQLDSGTGTWSFPRLTLRRLFYTLKRCTSVRIRLRSGTLRIDYGTVGRGRGHFVLLDQQTAVGADVFVIRLCSPVERPQAEPVLTTPTLRSSISGRTPPQPRLRSPSRDWLRDGAKLLLDAIASR